MAKRDRDRLPWAPGESWCTLQALIRNFNSFSVDVNNPSDRVPEPTSPSTAPHQEWDTPWEQGDPRCGLELMLHSTEAVVRHTVEAGMKGRPSVRIPKDVIPVEDPEMEDKGPAACELF